VSPRFSPSELFLKAQTDERLAALASEGHGRAFAVLIERHRRALLVHAQRLVGTQRGEDVVQEALLRAWHSLDRGVEVRHVQAWLHRIVHNAGLSDIERQVPPAHPLFEHLVDPCETPLAAEHRLQVREVLSSVSALPERQRLALLGMELEGRSRRQLAAELGLTEGAVRQLVHRARDAVRAAMAACVPFPLVTRAMTASGWIGSTDSSVPLHPAAEATALSGLAAGSVAKAGTALLAVGALGGGLLLHSKQPPKPPRPTPAPQLRGRPAARASAPRPTRSSVGVVMAGRQVAVAAFVDSHRAGPAGVRPAPTPVVGARAMLPQQTAIQPRRREPSASDGRDPGHLTAATPAGTTDPSRTGQSPGQSATDGGTDSGSSSSGASQPADTATVTSTASATGDQSSSGSLDSGATPTSSGASNGQSSPDSSSSSGTTTSSATGD
jgi:RNA polymerase sigma factor (sigma-70 family)